MAMTGRKRSDMASNEKSQPQSEHGTWAPIIAAVTTPLGLFALLVLVLESILGVVAMRAANGDFTILVYGMVGALILLLIIFAIVLLVKPGAIAPREPSGATSTPQPSPAVNYEFDAFVSAPMAAAETEKQYEDIRNDVLKVMQAIRDYLRMDKIYFAGESIPTKQDFDTQVLAIQDDFERIEQSKMFVMLYPKRLASSVLVEVGFALALKKPTVIFVHREDDLPYLLREAGQALHFVRTYEAANNAAVIALLKKNGSDLVPLL
jgi:hypothetical protein